MTRAILGGLDVAFAVGAVGLFALLCGPYRARWTKGRLITAPLARRLHLPCQPVRGLTALALMTLALVALWAPEGLIASAAASVGFVAVFADDLLTGDDDRWKRWKSRARNTVRWRMKLPAPARPRTAA